MARLRTSNDASTYTTALVTAHKLLGNIVDHPMEERYRRVKVSNPAFARRLGDVPGGRDLVLSAGFVFEDENDGGDGGGGGRGG